jgi:hypothetical protein
MVSIPTNYYLSGGRRFRAPRSYSRMGGLINPFRRSVKKSRKTGMGRRRTRKTRKSRKMSMGGRRRTRKTRKTRKGGATRRAGAMSAGAVRRKINALLKKL